MKVVASQNESTDLTNAQIKWDVLIRDPKEIHFHPLIESSHPIYWKLKKLAPLQRKLLELQYSGTTQTFYGKSALWHNTDLRIKFGTSYNRTLPFTFGVLGAFDYGRVWEANEKSKQWHYNYGGGFYFAPIDILVFSVAAYIPKEKNEQSPRVTLRLGFDSKAANI